MPCWAELRCLSTQWAIKENKICKKKAKKAGGSNCATLRPQHPKGWTQHLLVYCKYLIIGFLILRLVTTLMTAWANGGSARYGCAEPGELSQSASYLKTKHCKKLNLFMPKKLWENLFIVKQLDRAKLGCPIQIGRYIQTVRLGWWLLDIHVRMWNKLLLDIQF